MPASARLGAVVGRLAALLTVVIGLSVLAGWGFDLPQLRSMIPGAVEMKANTALALLMAGIALFMLGDREVVRLRTRVAQTLASAVAMLGLATFSEYVFGWQLGIDELLFRDTGTAYNLIRGRMSPLSAIAFTGIGLAMIAWPYRTVRPLTTILASGVAMIGGISLVGYAWSAQELVTDRWLPPVAIHSAIAFVLLAIGTLSTGNGQAGEFAIKVRALTRIERKVLVGIMVSMLLLLLGGALTYRSVAQIDEATKWVAHTHEVRLSIGKLYAGISEADRTKEKYLLTGQAGFRDDFSRLSALAEDELQVLAQLIGDDPGQLQNLARLRQLIAQVLAGFSASVAAHDGRQPASAGRHFASSADEPIMRETLALTQLMDGYEKSLLAAREKTLDSTRYVTLISLLFTLVLAVATYILQFSGIRREMQARAAAENARIASEASLRQREAELSRFKQSLDQTLDSIYLFRPDTLRFTYANRGSVVQVGYSVGELLGMTPLDLRPGDSEAEFRAMLEPLLKNEAESLVVETRHRRKDGVDIPVEVHIQLVRIDGEEAQFVKVARDISARRQAEAALRNSNARIRAILDTVADGIVTIDANGIVETINPACERIFGYPEEEIVGRNIKLLMPEPFHSQHDGYLEAFRAGGRTKIIGVGRELKGRRKDGSVLPIELTVSEMQLGGKRHFTGVVRDISKRKEAEEQLNRFFALSLDMLCISGADGYFKRVSPAFTKTLGWSVDEFLARPFADFVHPDDLAATLEAVDRQIKSGESVLQFENRYRHQDGSWRVLSWKSVPHEGGLMYAAARDITHRIEAEQALVVARDEAVRANTAKSVFLATMSHEIRTPLNGMLGMLELLTFSRLDAEQRETLEIARDSGRGVVRIIDDVLDHAKIEAGKLEILAEPLSISQLLRRLLNNYHALASAKGLTLSQIDDPRISPVLLGDPMRLLQILGNFVSNAVKFTASGGIEVSAEWLGRADGMDSIRLAVKDSGIGIDTATQGRLFQPFEQAAANTTRMYGGTGLGLAISRRLVEMMGGSIAVDSAPGLGTTFSIGLRLPITSLPLAGSAIRSSDPASQSLRLTAVSGEIPRVLAVDDNATNRLLLARQLDVLGLHVQTAADGREALAMWRQGDFGVLITDCNMPNMDGYALASAIRESELAEAGPPALIIAWTANVVADVAARCRAAGMDEILTKPAELAELKDVLVKRLGARGLRLLAEVPGTSPDLGGAGSPIDPAVFAEIVGIFGRNTPKLREFLDEFRSSMAVVAAGLRTASASADAATTAALAHQLKSSARSLGALPLGDLCARVEAAGNAGQTRTLSEVLPRIEAEIAAVDSYLNNFGAAPARQSTS